MTPSRDAINRFLAEQFPAASGIECLEVGERHAVARWAYDPSNLRPGGLISGPTQFALCRTQCLGCHRDLRPLRQMT